MLEDAVPLSECARALVIKLRYHGDVLLAAPVLSVLNARGVEVDALVYDDTAPMLEGHPALSRLHRVGRNWRGAGLSRLSDERRLFNDLRRRSYDLIVHLSEHPRGAWLARLLGARYSVAPKAAHGGAFWAKSFTHLFPVAARRHWVEVNLDALRRIGVQPGLEERRVQFVPGVEAEARIGALVNGEFVQVQPASRSCHKRWPTEKYAELIDRLAADGHRVVLTGARDPEKLAFVDDIAGRTRSAPLNLAGKLSIKELGALSARARLFFGVGRMPMHLACAMGTPTVALFGPNGEPEWGPWNVPHRVLSGKASECLATVSVEAVHAAVRELIAR